jgi:soluble cytochrome b562
MKAIISTCILAGALALGIPSTADAAATKPLGELMEDFDGAFKSFRRETDPEKGAAHAREAQAAAWAAINILPETVEKMPDGPAKSAAAAEYRRMMAEAYLTLCKIEIAFLKGDIEAVATHVTELREARKAGHDRFMED